MAKSKVTKRSFSSYETQRLILGVLLLALIITAIVFGYQTRSDRGEVGDPNQVNFSETNTSQEGTE